jgi:D-alanine-D-alanine ligase-like ATP-grasp enzyme
MEKLKEIMSKVPKFLTYSGSDIAYTHNGEGTNNMTLIELNSCPGFTSSNLSTIKNPFYPY